MLIVLYVKCDLCTNQDESGFLCVPKGLEVGIPDVGCEWWLVSARRAMMATRTQLYSGARRPGVCLPF